MHLEPGENKAVEITLDRDSFAFYNPEAQAWMAEQGTYNIFIGSSLEDIRLQQQFVLEESMQE